MREFEQLNDAIPIAQKHVQQIIASWLGLTGNGTDADLAGVPLRQTSVNDDTLYAVDARNRGSGGKHYRATHSSGSPVLFSVTDAGVLVSIDGGAASNPFFYPSMVVAWNNTAASIPSGWTVITAAKTRVIYGANADGDVGATGGAATYDISHNHTQNAHNHTQDAHTHSHNHDYAHRHTHDHDHPYTADHNHPTEDSGPAKTGAGVSFETGDPIAGPSLEYTLDRHIHDTFINTFSAPTLDTGAVQNESWTLVNLVPGESSSNTNTSTNAQSTTATNQSTTATNNTAGSAAQNVLNPFIRYYHIQRT